jgi:hypothetical protein
VFTILISNSAWIRKENEEYEKLGERLLVSERLFKKWPVV